MANPAATAVMGSAGEAVIDSTAIARLTGWSFNPQNAMSEWGDSDSAGYTNVRPGRKSGSGQMEGKLDSDSEFYEVFDLGDEPALTLWINTTLYFYLPCAVIQSYSLAVNRDSGEVIGWSSNFAASGIFYHPGQSGVPVKTYPS